MRRFPLSALIQIIGFIAFMRGFLMLRAQADGASNISTAASFTHLIGGAVAFNISSFLGMVQYTFCQGAASCNVSCSVHQRPALSYRRAADAACFFAA